MIRNDNFLAGKVGPATKPLALVRYSLYHPSVTEQVVVLKGPALELLVAAESGRKHKKCKALFKREFDEGPACGEWPKEVPEATSVIAESRNVLP